MKTYLLPEKGNFYKANLHTHSTVSDGKLTPEEVKEYYKSNGYSIVAYTDHNVIVRHNDLTDDGFLAITSFEVYVNEEYPAPLDYNFAKVYHFCLYAKDANNVECPFFSERDIGMKHMLKYVTDDMRKYDSDKSYNIECVNELIKESNEAGFLVSYNHPKWSMQNYLDYRDLEGVWGVEVYNSEANFSSGLTDNDQAFVDMLRDGKEVFPLATDDIHNQGSAFGGFVMVKADELKYDVVMKALEKGDFYASTGPEICELYLEDNMLKFKCKGAKRVCILTERRYSLMVDFDSTDGVQEGNVDLAFYLEKTKECKDCLRFKPYIRLLVEGEDGKKAYTRAYFLNEFNLI